MVHKFVRKNHFKWTLSPHLAKWDLADFKSTLSQHLKNWADSQFMYQVPSDTLISLHIFLADSSSFLLPGLPPNTEIPASGRLPHVALPLSWTVHRMKTYVMTSWPRIVEFKYMTKSTHSSGTELHVLHEITDAVTPAAFRRICGAGTLHVVPTQVVCIFLFQCSIIKYSSIILIATISFI